MEQKLSKKKRKRGKNIAFLPWKKGGKNKQNNNGLQNPRKRKVSKSDEK